MRGLAAVLAALVLVALFPEPAWAWGPATHVYLGSALLDALHLVPETVRLLLQAHPHHFLYGSVAADISLAKKYVPEGRHCHHWHVGEEILSSAESDRMRAMGLGYLAHLAADTVAHNYYVPRQLLLTSTTKALGHSYWEHRMDVQLGERWTGLARQVVMENDHAEADALFDRVLSRTLFSFRTNRRIFRGMIRFQDNDRWQAIFGTVLENSRWKLPERTIHGYVERSFDYIVDYLSRRADSLPSSLDPIGDRNLGVAKKLRRAALQNGAWQKPTLLQKMADQHFPLPEVPFGLWDRRAAPGAGEASELV